MTCMNGQDDAIPISPYLRIFVKNKVGIRCKKSSTSYGDVVLLVARPLEVDN